MKKGIIRAIRGHPAEAQRARLHVAGLKDRQIYEIGKGAETLESCIASFRREGGELLIGADMRIFAANPRARPKPQITAAADMIEEAGIKLRDIHNIEDGDRLWRMVDRAVRAAAFDKRWAGDKKKARTVGAIGGKARGAAFARDRSPPEFAGPIWAKEHLTIPERLALMNPEGYKRQWTAATARKYLNRYRNQ